MSALLLSVMLFEIMLPLLERAGFLHIYCNGTDEEAPDLKQLGLCVKQDLGKKETVLTAPPERVCPLTPKPSLPSSVAAPGPGIIRAGAGKRTTWKEVSNLPISTWVGRCLFFFFFKRC